MEALLAISARANAFILQRMNQRYIKFVCGAFLTIYLAALAVSFATQSNGRTVYGPPLGADYASFYVAGKIYAEIAPAQIYNRAVQTQLYQELTHNLDTSSGLPFANAPFFVLPFAALSRLPYTWSFATWMILAAALYIGGMRLVWASTDHLPRDAWVTVLLLGVTFVPFLLESLTGGQVSAFGFFSLSLAFFLEKRRRPYLSGAALALCLYKPTLLLLILPMLFFTRRWRTLAGFAIAAAALAAVSILAVGWGGWISYLNALLYFTGESTAAASGLRTWKYIDFNSFYRLLVGGYPLVRWGLTLATVIALGPKLIRAWQQGSRGKPDGQALLWALTISWTTVLNFYVGIYDSVILVLSAILSADVLFGGRESPADGLAVEYKYLLLLLYVTPWFTEFVAAAIHIQIMTLVVTAYGLYLLNRRTSLRPTGD